MKKLFLILALVCMSVGASAQEIYNEVKRIEKEVKAFANDTSKDLDKEVIYSYVDNENYITQFSLDTDWPKALAEVTGK